MPSRLVGYFCRAALASSSGDEMIKLWDASTGKCLKTLKCEKPYEGMNICDVTGLAEVTLATLKALGAIEDDLVVAEKRY